MEDKTVLMLKNIKRILSLFVLIFHFCLSNAVFAGSGWLIYHESAFKGIVIDAETKEPIEGAVVIAKYHVNTWGPVESSTDLIDVRETLTNKKGEFFMPPLTRIISPLSKGDYTSFLIWKPGYKPVSEPPAIIGEFFFSKEPGTIGTRRVYTDSGIELIPVRLGIVELVKVKTKEERRMVSVGPEGERSDWKKQKQFIKLIREEWEYITGKPAGDLYKIE